ncbi:MAG: hypothetical protein M1829_002404 [Trizodia sp. TS-e1964]|nr:MAG: hypothetical protein M1829_002404 [Trizodia sp. TS-e1964]
MRFSTPLGLVAAFAVTVLAQSNPFAIPPSGLSFKAGSTGTISWTPTTSGTVTLILRSGASTSLNTGTTIASKIPNSGSLSFSIPSDIVRGSDYGEFMLPVVVNISRTLTPIFFRAQLSRLLMTQTLATPTSLLNS